MASTDQDVFVIFTPDVPKMKHFFERLGLEFVQEKHGDGPEHFACAYDDVVLEIYPSKKDERVKWITGPKSNG